MKPHDNIPDPRFFPAEDSPIPLPPVDESWTLLQKKLDNEGKRRGIAWWWMLAGILAGGLVLWTGARYFSGSSFVRSHPEASVRSDPRASAGTQELARRAAGASAQAVAGRVPGAVAPAAQTATAPAASVSVGGGAGATGVGPARLADGTSGVENGARMPGHAGAANGGTSGSPRTEAGELSIIGGSPLIGASKPLTGASEKDLFYYPAAAPYVFFDETDRHPPITMGAAAIDTSVKRNKRGLWMTAGLTLLQNAPLGNQLIYDYNINGKGNLASDYIPAPYFQYFLRPNLYVQVTLRWNSPQYTPTLPIDSARTETGSKQTVFTTSTLQKLYYTDLPLTIGYSPLAHLFLGGGIQYSGLRGGFVYQRIVSYDSVSLLPIVYRTGTLSKRMEETLQLRRTDWRILLEANYYWNRFSLGLRYQQALGDFRRTGGSGEKNNALGFYLQYNLWEHRRKND